MGAGSLAIGLGDLSDSDDLTAALGKQTSSLLKRGKELTGGGMAALGPAISRLMKLLSGNEALIDQAIAPEAKGVISQYDTARRSIAEFGGRGAGTASTLAESRFREAGDLSSLRFGATKQATDQLTSIAELLLGAGNRMEAEGTSGLANLLQNALAGEAQTREMWMGIGKLAGAAALTYFTGGAAAPLLVSAASDTFGGQQRSVPQLGPGNSFGPMMQTQQLVNPVGDYSSYY